MNSTLRNKISTAKKLMPIFAFAVPLLILYHLCPASFSMTWKGRTYYLFFIWLLVMETILNSEALEVRWGGKSFKTLILSVVLALPTVYVITANYAGFNDSIVNFAVNRGVYPDHVWLMPLAVEYLTFTILLVLVIVAEYKIETLTKYSLSIFFLGTIGLVYLVDNLYPFGRFIPFQIIVPTTSQLAANVLNTMGFKTTLSNSIDPAYGSITTLKVYNAQDALLARFGIAWPCAGVDSLLLYSIVTLLFLREFIPSLKAKLAYFFIGAAVTYFINVLRIVSIFLVAINGGDWRRFHDYYGPLYSVVWIISYLLIIAGTQLIWRVIKNRFIR
jgi:thaumarchaeosortase